MAKLVCIDLMGDLQSGCWASLKIFTEGDRDWIGEAQGKLPACLEISELYSDWQERYLARVAPMTAMRAAARVGARKRSPNKEDLCRKSIYQLQADIKTQT